MVKETTQAITEIPAIAFQNYPVDVYLRIYQQGTQYELEIHADGQTLRRPVPVSSHDLAVLNTQLRNAVEAVIQENIAEAKPTTEELETQLRPIAEVGNYAFQRVFDHPDALEMIQQLVAHSERVSIQVASEDFFLPWELIYPLSMDEPLSCEHFWGMKHVISRIIVQDTRPGAFVSPTVYVHPCPKLALLADSGLPSVIEREIPFFERMADNGKIALLKLRGLEPDRKQEGFNEFKRFWSNAFDIAHFACHASYEDRAPELSYILLSNDFPISIMDMQVYGIAISGRPLIIINACKTGTLNPLYTSHFARVFLKYGARGVVATECPVPEAFAADFTEQLYAHLLKQEPLGKSLLTIRRYFFEEYHNPSGLLYSLYAPPSIRFVRRGE